jgi:deoxycytidylate deaminase
MIAHVVSLRSDDRFIKHGAVIVSNLSKHIIGTGYNCTMRGANTNIIDLNDRDSRRPFMIHAEENAILNCTKNPAELSDGATIYITGTPCNNCLQRIINFGINTVIFTKRQGSIKEEDEREKKDRLKIIRMVAHKNLYIREYPEGSQWLSKIAHDFSSCINC